MKTFRYYLGLNLSALALPVLFACVTTFYTILYVPARFTGKGWLHFGKQFGTEWLSWFLIPALFALPTLLSNATSFWLLSRINRVSFWPVLILSVLINSCLIFLLYLEDGMRNAALTSVTWGSPLGIMSAMTFYLLAIGKNGKDLVKQKRFAFKQLAFTCLILSGYALLVKLFIGSYYPESGRSVYLAVKSTPSFTSVFQSLPQKQFELLKGKNSFLGYEYFDMIFVWIWWVLPAVTGMLLLLLWFGGRTKSKGKAKTQSKK